MKKMTINKCLMAAIILMLPALYISPIRNHFDIILANASVPADGAILLFLLLFSIFIFTPFWCKVTFASGMNFRIMGTLIIFVIIQLVYGIDDEGGGSESIAFLISTVIPIFVAIGFKKFFSKSNPEKIIEKFICLFNIYLFINIIYWFYVLSRKQVVSTGLSFKRMGGTFAPDVILGYTIALVFPIFLLIMGRDQKTASRKLAFWVMFFVFLISSFLTGSRGSFWVVMVWFLLWIIFLNKQKMSIFYASIAFFLVVVFFQYKNVSYERLLSTSERARTSSFVAAANYWTTLPMLQKVFGAGIGNVYPYQKWLSDGRNIYDNEIYISGKMSIVHPHNSFMWVLVECGTLGLFLFCWPIIEIVKKFIKNNSIVKNFKTISKIFFVFGIFFTFILLNALDSILLINPRVAFVWWSILFIVGDLNVTNSLSMIKTKYNF